MSDGVLDVARTLLQACRQAYEEMNGDYVDEVWHRDLRYLRSAIEAGAKHLGEAPELADRSTRGDETAEATEARMKEGQAGEPESFQFGVLKISSSVATVSSPESVRLMMDAAERAENPAIWPYRLSPPSFFDVSG